MPPRPSCRRSTRGTTPARVHAQLRDFYESLRTTANQALSASIRNDDVYKDAARTVLQQLAALPAISSASRDLAQTAGVELPAVDTP